MNYAARMSTETARSRSKRSEIESLICASKLSSLAKVPITAEEAIYNRLPGWIGDHLVRTEKSKKGLEYYNEGLEKNPHDARLLFKRANANGKCFRMDKGLADIEKSLKIDPTDINAVACRLNFMYLNGEFEKSLLLSYEKLKIRRKPPYFVHGLQRARGAINNCIGSLAGHPMRDHYEIIRELAWKKNMSMQKGHPKRRRRRRKRSTPVTSFTSLPGAQQMGSAKPTKPVKSCMTSIDEIEDEVEEEVSLAASSFIDDPYTKKKKTGFSSKISRVREVPRNSRLRRISSLESKFDSLFSLTTQSVASSLGGSHSKQEKSFVVPKVYMYPYHPLQRRTTNIENYLSCTYLGQLLHEKKFLTALPKKDGCMGQNIDANHVIIGAREDGLFILEQAQEILRTRRPFYHIKYQEQLRKSKNVEADNLEFLERKKCNAVKKLNGYFTLIAKYVKRMDNRHMIRTAEIMYKYCKNTHKAVLPDKDSVLCRLYKLVGDGFLLSNRFTPEMTQQQMMTRINLALGLPIVRTISQESLYRRFRGRALNWVEMISTYEQRVRSCKCSEELIWLYHELSRFNIEMKRLSLAKTYAGKCIHEARKCENFKWAINGYMLMAKISVLQKNRNDIRRQLKIAISAAKNLKNDELGTFLQTCLEVINEWRFEDDNVEHLFKQRQERIIQLITNYDTRRKAWLMFQEMNRKPPDRRLPVIPGLASTDEYDAIQRRLEERRQEQQTSVPERRGIEAEQLIEGYLIRKYS